MSDNVKDHKEFLSAAAAVYLWVSAADGEITKSEVNSFVEYLNSLEYVDEVTDSDFEELYLDLLSKFETDYDDGLSRAQIRIESFKGDALKCKDLLKVARRAAVSDEKLSDSEEVVLAEIATLLGLDEKDII